MEKWKNGKMKNKIKRSLIFQSVRVAEWLGM
jgi:hypothetical protein